MATNHNPVGRILPYRTEDLENTVTSGSDNVYADLGFENPEEMLLKAHLVMLLSKAIKAKGLNQYQAAELLGIAQPKVSALVRGQFRGYSLERLFKFLNALDRDVEVNVRSKPEERERSCINFVLHKINKIIRLFTEVYLILVL
jgi:predicted XRE-type DNA-binding protein